MLKCPRCQGAVVVKNGHIHNGKQRYLCKGCGRQFVPGATKKVVSDETRALVDRLMLEKLPLAGIARSVQVSETWLQSYAKRKLEAIPQYLAVKEKKGR